MGKEVQILHLASSKFVFIFISFLNKVGHLDAVFILSLHGDFSRNVFPQLRNVSKVSNTYFSSSQAQRCMTSFYKFNIAAHSFTYRLIYFTCTTHALMTVNCSANVVHFHAYLVYPSTQEGL